MKMEFSDAQKNSYKREILRFLSQVVSPLGASFLVSVKAVRAGGV